MQSSSKASGLLYGEDEAHAPEFVDWFTFFSLFSNVRANFPSFVFQELFSIGRDLTLSLADLQDRGVKLRINIADTILICPRGGIAVSRSLTQP